VKSAQYLSSDYVHRGIYTTCLSSSEQPVSADRILQSLKFVAVSATYKALVIKAAGSVAITSIEEGLQAVGNGAGCGPERVFHGAANLFKRQRLYLRKLLYYGV
jgi:hypothetical protein